MDEMLHIRNINEGSFIDIEILLGYTLIFISKAEKRRVNFCITNMIVLTGGVTLINVVSIDTIEIYKFVI
jgi:hypothetical protein